MSADATHVVGFDLGHGNAALAWVSIVGKNGPEVLEIGASKQWEITAIARDPERGVLIGETALRMGGASEFDIGFKKRPSLMSPDDCRDICDFVAEVYARAVRTKLFPDDDHTHVYVGCPSGWYDDEVAAYKELLAGTGIPELTVVSESRAAMMHATENDQLRVAQLGGWWLVVDIGSSTTDFTRVRNEELEPTDLGVDLGGSLIDRAILRRSLADPQLANRQAINDLVERDRSWRNRLELTCREAKEEYFKHPDRYVEEEDTVPSRLRMPGIGRFEPRLNKSIMDEVLSQPLPELIERQDDAGGQAQTWPGALRHELQKAADETTRQGLDLRTILLTGGGSRMPFVEQICKEIFPGVNCVLGSEPELCIARGLAHWGRLDVRMSSCLEEVNVFLDERLAGIVKSHLPDLINGLAGSLADGLVHQVIAADLRAWRDGDIQTMEDLEALLSADMQSWLEDPAGQETMAQQEAACVNTVYGDLEQGMAPIFARYGLGGVLAPSSDVNLQFALDGIAGGLQVDSLGGLAMPIGGIITFGVIAILPAAILSVAILPAILIAVVVGSFFQGAVEQWAKGDLPPRARKLLLSDGKIDKQLIKMKSELGKTLLNKLNDDATLQQSLTESIGARMRLAVNAKVKAARLLIS